MEGRGEAVMSIQEWRSCDHPERMLSLLRDQLSPRKLQLFACACCRQAWHLLTDAPARRVVEVSEDFAEGLAEDGEWQATVRRAQTPLGSIMGLFGQVPHLDGARWRARLAALAATQADGAWRSSRLAAEALAMEAAAAVERKAARETVALWAARGLNPPTEWGHLMNQRLRQERAEQRQVQTVLDTRRALAFAAQARLLREMVGPAPLPFTLAPAWLTWNDHTVPRLAQAIHDQQAFDRMPILGDALEEAGCTDVDVLDHCRQSEYHVRGCWVIDLVLALA